MNTGLSDRDLMTINDILKKYPEVLKVNIFGSRAKGNFKKGSDIDLVILNSNVDDRTVSRISSDFDDSTLPYFVDIIDYDHINAPALKDHIDRVSFNIYQASLQAIE
jgi:predicted nucleotidyltransferase